MKLLVVSHKVCWRDASSPTGYATDGGFPFQMQALSELFDETELLLPFDPSPLPAGSIALRGTNMTVRTMPLPSGSDLRRKLSLLAWMPRNLPRIWMRVGGAEAVHTPIPGDIGTFGMLAAFARRKPLYVRHGGNWLEQHTRAERFWKWFMERYADGRNVMLATGGAAEPPSRKNARVHWIFSTTLSEETLRASGQERECPRGRALRLISVGRLDAGKGVQRTLAALALLREQGMDCALDVAGDGAYRPRLEALARELGVSDAVVFHGKVGQQRVLDLLRDADLFVFPTDSEGFPKAVLEALASGLPVVTTPVSVLPHLLAGGSGLLLSALDPAAIAEGIRSCIRVAETYEAMSRAALHTASGYTLERWKDVLRRELEAAWGPLKRHD